MADRPQIEKRNRDEYEGNFIPRPPPRIATNTSSLAYPLRMRELGKTMKLPHIYRDYYVRSFEHEGMGSVTFMVTGADTILVVYSSKDLVLFRREGDQILPVHCNINMDRSIRAQRAKGVIISVCYNKHNNSFLIAHRVFHMELQCAGVELISLDIASIKGGESVKTTRLLPGESCASPKEWCFDIPNCRAIIHDLNDHTFKCCELKEYTMLFAITNLGFTNVTPRNVICSNLKSTSPGNMDIVIYDRNPSTKSNGMYGVELRMYSKLNGILQKEILLPRRTTEDVKFVVLCGSNTLLIQHDSSKMEVVEICGENPVSINIRNTNISALPDPYYLCKRSQFICAIESGKIQVCNLQGEILVTLEDHPIAELWPRLHSTNIFRYSYISDSQDVIISLCRRCLPALSREWIYSVNVSSIVTGKCLAKISSEDPNCSEIRKAVLNDAVWAFAFDESTHDIFTGNDDGLCGVWSNEFYKDGGEEN